MSDKNSNFVNIILNDIKRFLQWILGCTYAKKSVSARIREMFHFGDAPFIIIHHVEDEKESWWTKIGIIIGIMIVVMVAYYLIESLIKSIRSFVKKVFTEPQSTVSTPRMLSPSGSKERLVARIEKPKSPTSEQVTIVRQQVRMNQPVNCVFIRPTSPGMKTDGTQQYSDSDGQQTTSPVFVTPPAQPTPNKSSEERKPTGSDALSVEMETFSNAGIMEWFNSGNLESSSETEETCEQGNIDSEFMNEIKKIIAGVMESDSDKVSESDGECNISEMSTVTESAVSLNSEDDFSLSVVPQTPNHQEDIMGKEVSKTTEEDFDILIEDNYLFAESENHSFGNVYLQNGQSKVLFRWTDKNIQTVDSVTITGSFFGWKMSLPMKKNMENGLFTTCLELPEGLHEYKIEVFRFDS